MNSIFPVFNEHTSAAFLVEPSAWEGVRRVAEQICEDLKLMTDRPPALAATLEDVQCPEMILAATVGKSPLLDRLVSEGRVSIGSVAGKREVFSLQIVPGPFPEMPFIRRLMLIVGSDKRGTEYGLFELEKRCGASPLIWWGDVTPPRRRAVEVKLTEPYVSEEPSVKYRGFFINDEWPAFGSWCTEKFGGFNARCYEQVFLLLLRLRGNYLWPAMWSAVFSEDGPGLENARLADMYGVIMGTSHHEPLCRAGEEWKKTWRRYGDRPEWSFVTNAGAITRFWEDGVRRNMDFENVITVGMRGEADSKLLGEDATLSDNIDVVKKAVLAQHGILKRLISPDLASVPRVLAVYKEVEDFWYGDEGAPGLRDWEELSDVIFLLSDDNFGNLRTLPRPSDPPHPGGYGMYYHFDYHGEPISYEWLCGNPLPKIWEQMTSAWDHGVRELWIVNVGDLKGSELPLCYFMALAYDYGTWAAPGKTGEFTRKWTVQQFGGAGDKTARRLAALMEGWSRLNALRRPEALTPETYHPVHFREGERVWRWAQSLTDEAEALTPLVPAELRDAYLGMIGLPALLTANLVQMNIEAGWNHRLGKLGCVSANALADSVRRRIRRDGELVSLFHALAGHKWNHMLDSAHCGFRTWDSHDWHWPEITYVTPIPGPKALINVRGSEDFHLGHHWQDKGPLECPAFLDPSVSSAVVDIHCRGSVGFVWRANVSVLWLSLSPASGHVTPDGCGFGSCEVAIDRKKITAGQAVLRIDMTFDDGSETHSEIAFPAVGESPGPLSIDAAHFSDKHDTPEGGYTVIPGLGRVGDAVKVFPANRVWRGDENRPWLEYAFEVKEGGDYTLALYTLSRNPLSRGDRLTVDISINGGAPVPLHTVSGVFRTGDGSDEWGRAVLAGARVTSLDIPLIQGPNRLRVLPVSPNVVLERIVLQAKSSPLMTSYLGAPGYTCRQRNS